MGRCRHSRGCAGAASLAGLLVLPNCSSEALGHVAKGAVGCDPEARCSRSPARAPHTAHSCAVQPPERLHQHQHPALQDCPAVQHLWPACPVGHKDVRTELQQLFMAVRIMQHASGCIDDPWQGPACCVAPAVTSQLQSASVALHSWVPLVRTLTPATVWYCHQHVPDTSTT